MKIYALIDPRDNAVRYVGRTEQLLRIRLSAHISDARTYLFEGKPQSCASRKAEWLRELKTVGQRPRIRLLARVKASSARVAERQWVAKLLAEGAPLTNGCLIRPEHKEWLRGYGAALAMLWRNHERICQQPTTRRPMAKAIRVALGDADFTYEMLRIAGVEENDLDALARAIATDTGRAR